MIDDEQLNTVSEIDEQPFSDIEQAEEVEQADVTTPTVTDEAKADAGNAPEQARKRGKAEIIVNVALWVAIAVLLVAVILRLFVFSTVAVDGASMNPTYEHGNVVTVNKAVSPKRGDVVVFYVHEVKNKFLAQFAKPEECTKDQPYEKYIKRVVALEGDKLWAREIEIADGDKAYQIVVDTVDGKRLIEDYYVKKGESLNSQTFYIHAHAPSNLGLLAECTEAKPYVVGKGCFFAMGDNRDNSKDSRELGAFKLSQLFGVVLDK